jgi:hypothetical protein
MKLKSRILIYLLIPIGILVKVLLFVLLLNLAEGCKNRNDKGLRDIEGYNSNTVTISMSLKI